jgi:hypothetical protein
VLRATHARPSPVLTNELLRSPKFPSPESTRILFIALPLGQRQGIRRYGRWLREREQGDRVGVLLGLGGGSVSSFFRNDVQHDPCYATGGMGAGPLVAAVQIPVHNESARRTAVKRTHTRPSK